MEIPVQLVRYRSCKTEAICLICQIILRDRKISFPFDVLSAAVYSWEKMANDAKKHEKNGDNDRMSYCLALLFCRPNKLSI